MSNYQRTILWMGLILVFLNIYFSANWSQVKAMIIGTPKTAPKASPPPLLAPGAPGTNPPGSTGNPVIPATLTTPSTAQVTNA